MLSEHFSALLKAFRRELNSKQQQQQQPLRKNEDCNPWKEQSEVQRTNQPSFETLRDNPEIMMKLYSYLPLGDRICRLSLVDREFSRDTIRGGVVSATYGPGFNLKQALLELQRWAREQFESELKFGSCANATTLDDHKKRIAKISRMLDAANLTDGELLLFSGSNLVNEIVPPSERKRWMTSYACDFFAREKEQRTRNNYRSNNNTKDEIRGIRGWGRLFSCRNSSSATFSTEQQQQQQQQQQKRRNRGDSWLEEIVLVQKFLKRYFFDGTMGRLEELMSDAEFLDDFVMYEHCQNFSITHVDDDGKLVWCLPNLRSRGCNLLLLHPDGGWKEHRFVTCQGCSKLFQSNNNGVCCPHGHHGHLCKECCDRCGKYLGGQVADILKSNMVGKNCCRASRERLYAVSAGNL